jgi:uroporphyrinogen decarboxylase
MTYMKPMTSKARVLTAFARQKPDRVPVNYYANAGIDRRLKRHFGLRDDDDEGLRRALGVDFRSVGPNYRGPKRHADVPGRSVDAWGIHRRWVEHESGGYWDFCDFPLREATLAQVEAWPLPSPDDYDYTGITAVCEAHRDCCIVAGGAGMADIINSTGFLRSPEQALVDLITDDDAGLCLIDRKMAHDYAVLCRTLDAAQGKVDLLWIGEDLGTQRGPMISRELYRKHIQPRHQRFVDLARRWRIPVVIHCCGSSSCAFDDFIEMGISVVDTLQPEAAEMSPAYLKRRYGKRLAFHGAISTTGAVSFGSVADTVRDVRAVLKALMPGGGYALAPCHCLQDNSPTENVLALYAAARRYGRYRT